jgi:ribonuclease PH
VCVALLDAGVALRSTIAATSVALMNERLIVDPTKFEEEQSQAIFTFAYLHSNSNLDEIAQSHTIGSFEFEQFQAASRLAADTCRSIFATIRLKIEQQYLPY